jgi:hypothetical protein
VEGSRFLKWKVPVKQVVRTVKTRNDGAQAFRGSMPMQLVKKDGAGVALKSVEPNIKLEGFKTCNSPRWRAIACNA